MLTAASKENDSKPPSQTIIHHKKNKKIPSSLHSAPPMGQPQVTWSPSTKDVGCLEKMSPWFLSLSSLSCPSCFFSWCLNYLKTFTLTVISNFITKIPGMRTTELICLCLYLSLQNEWIAAFNENAVFWNSSFKIIKTFPCFISITSSQSFVLKKMYLPPALFILHYEITKTCAGLKLIPNAKTWELKGGNNDGLMSTLN